ncbi:uncharacterized protein B0H18DRAFT_955892 [Fomitopsis serialis]|uniref:uncharacterized protein n=1 Tax=Fomitopsis serialis TaxID=139415 RepID=UPI00200864A1|nr:uncharacterized protein B0H18DRAFT_955892 [Neoantrodia serialis]KAH9923345.1 hypothetical protein B0H18DRAFT_955892 [Neoantrodia serialis]
MAFLRFLATLMERAAVVFWRLLPLLNGTTVFFAKHVLSCQAIAQAENGELQIDNSDGGALLIALLPCDRFLWLISEIATVGSRCDMPPLNTDAAQLTVLWHESCMMPATLALALSLPYTSSLRSWTNSSMLGIWGFWGEPASWRVLLADFLSRRQNHKKFARRDLAASCSESLFLAQFSTYWLGNYSVRFASNMAKFEGLKISIFGCAREGERRRRAEERPGSVGNGWDMFGWVVCSAQKCDAFESSRRDAAPGIKNTARFAKLKILIPGFRLSRSGLQNKQRPIALLARGTFWYEQDVHEHDAKIRIDGSEYSGKHSITRLIGAPPSYVGRDQGVQLTDYIRRKPNSIVLNDEIETASREFVALFLQTVKLAWLSNLSAMCPRQARDAQARHGRDPRTFPPSGTCYSRRSERWRRGWWASRLDPTASSKYTMHPPLQSAEQEKCCNSGCVHARQLSFASRTPSSTATNVARHARPSTPHYFLTFRYPDIGRGRGRDDPAKPLRISASSHSLRDSEKRCTRCSPGSTSLCNFVIAAQAIDNVSSTRSTIVSQPPSIELREVSPDERQFLFMLYIGQITFGAIGLYLGNEGDEPVDFSKKASIIFVRLPSGYFVLMVKAKDSSPGVDDRLHTVMLTAEVSFRFDEDPPTTQWLQEGSSFTIHFDDCDGLRALMRCILIARSACTAVNTEVARDEADTLQARLKHMDEAAIIAAIETSTAKV